MQIESNINQQSTITPFPTRIYHNEYGGLLSSHEKITSLIRDARSLAAQAAQKNKIPESYEDLDWDSRYKKRLGDALHHEVLDVTPDGKKALICCRAVEGTRYGIKTTQKRYYIVARHGTGVRVLPASLAVSAKYAKTATSLGEAISKLLKKTN